MSALRWLLLARRRALAPLPWLAGGAALALVFARAVGAQASVPPAARANQALATWLVLGALVTAAVAAVACTRAGARAAREAAWLARWPRRPALARAALCACCALYAGAAAGVAFGAGALALAPRTHWTATHVRAWVGPELWLEPGARTERWLLADPRGLLTNETRLSFRLEAPGGAGARARLRATRVDPDSGARGATTEVEQWVRGSAQLLFAPPTGSGEVELALEHVAGRAALHLCANDAQLCIDGARAWRACAWLAARAAAACAALAALGYGLAQWMRAPLAAASAAVLCGALALRSASLGGDWSACSAWIAREIAPAAPPLAQLALLALCALTGVLASTRGGRGA